MVTDSLGILLVSYKPLWCIYIHSIACFNTPAEARKGTTSDDQEQPAPPDRFRQSSATTSLPDASQLDALDFSVALSRVVRAMMIARQAQAAVRAWLREGLSQGFGVHEMSHGTNCRRAQTTLEVYKRGRDRLACTGALAVQTRPESS